jgi:hypothetical protein
MTENEKGIINGFLSKTLKLDTEVLASLYNDAGELTTIEPALKADETRISDHKKENTNQYNRGLKESFTKLEKQIKEQYDVNSDKIGIELVNEIVAAETAKASKSKGEVDDKHPKIIELKSLHDKALKARDAEWEKKVKEKDDHFAKQKNLDKIKELAWIEIESKNPILPEDAKKAATWRNTFLREIESGNYQMNEDGTVVVLDKEGKIATDSHGHTISFTDHVNEQGEKYFDFPAASTARSSATVPGADKTKKVPPVKPIKDSTEYAEKMKEMKTPEERANLTKQWISQQTKN